MVAGAGEVRTVHDGNLKTGNYRKSTQRTADLQLAGQRPKAPASFHGQLRGKPENHPGLRDAEETRILGNRGIYHHGGMFFPGHRGRAVTARYP